MPRLCVAALLLALAVVMPVVPAQAATSATPAPSYPTAPPAAICGNAGLLDGPATRPAGAVEVDPGQDLAALTDANPPATTFWLAPGVHHLGPDATDYVVPKDGNVYVGAPGAVLDGRRVNGYAFGWYATGVTIRHLTIQHFGAAGTYLHQGAVNHEHATGWTIERNTIRRNAGAAVVVGSENVVRHNCLVENGQYGVNVFKANGVVLDQNEIARNNADDWETRIPGCGCSGASKFWMSSSVDITSNWVHDNRGPGLWVDTNNVGYRIEGNYVEGNDGEGIYYEISYNARIAGNTLKGNALVKGRAFAAAGNGFPVAAIYVAESGGDARLHGGAFSTLEITGNLLEDNWGGVVLSEIADRFCGASGPAVCTLVGAASPETCVAGTIENEPYYSDCRWKTQNVLVTGNELRIDKAAIGCAGTPCGQQALVSNNGTTPPYLGTSVQDAVTFAQNNRFSANRYYGDWRFTAWESGRTMDFASWQGPLYRQDAGSTLDTGPVVPVANYLDSDTSGLEGSVGQWLPWFSTAISPSTAKAHGGVRSLKVDVTAVYGWGVTMRNYQGVPAGPGPKTVSFWGAAGTGAGLSATLTVHWRDAAGAELQSDRVVIANLDGTWKQGTADVVAPPGTARLGVDLTSSTGGPGDVVFVDDVVVADAASGVPPPPAGALDADTATLEGSPGQWLPWFSTAVSSSADQAHGGARSLRVDIEAPYGWGVTQGNHPGFATTPGNKRIGFWGRAGAGGNLAATMTVHWRDVAGAELKADVLRLSLTPTWTESVATVAAPPGTARVAVDFTGSVGGPGDSLYLDDIFVADSAAEPPPPPPPTGALDHDTATLEGSTGHWIPWFSTQVASSDEQAHTGSRSLKVGINAAHGWGVTQSNFPGFAATPGNKTIGVWGRAGAGANLTATMTVHWRDAAGAELKADVLRLGLTTAWTEVTATVAAPAGTARVAVDFTGSAGGPGDWLYLDDVTVADTAAQPPPAPPSTGGALDHDTATLEGSSGEWLPWFSTAITSSAEQAHAGTRSLKIAINAPHGWGVTQGNYPGFATGPGAHVIGLWAMAGSGAGLAVTMDVSWRTAEGTVLQSDQVVVVAGPSWTEARATVNAPAGTARVHVDLRGASGQAGDVIYVDDVMVAPTA